MEYEILTGENTSELEHSVKTLILQGWRPQGGLSTWLWTDHRDYGNKKVGFAQAMVRGSDELEVTGHCPTIIEFSEDEKAIELVEKARCRDGGSILYTDEQGKPYWQDFRIASEERGRLYEGEYSFTDKPAKGKFLVEGQISSLIIQK